MPEDFESSARRAFGLDDDDDENLPLAARPSTDWLARGLIIFIVLAAVACFALGQLLP